MPGHLLSYPGNLGRLQQAAFADPTDFVQLSEADSWLVGGDGTASKSINWTGGGSTGTTTSFKQNYSFDADMSGVATVGLGGVLTAEASLSLDLSGSVGFSNLTNTLKTLSATQGIELTRTASFLSDQQLRLRGHAAYLRQAAADDGRGRQLHARRCADLRGPAHRP